MKMLFCAVGVIAALVAGTAFADVVSVSPGSADDAAAINAAIVSAGEGGKVTLADGTYHLTAPVDVKIDVELVGNDADRTKVILDGAGTSRLIEVGNNSAFVHGLTFANGKSTLTDNRAHGPVYVTAGVISNCVAHALRGKYCGGVGLYPQNTGEEAFAKELLIYDCSATDSGLAGAGAGLRLLGSHLAVADRCTITNCAPASYSAVRLDNNNAKLLNSTIALNKKCGISLVKGLVSNCVVRACTRPNENGGGIYMEGGTVRDTLVTGCSAGTGGGVYMAKASTLRNCTVAGNTATASAPGIYQAVGSIVNCIAWNNGSPVYLTDDQSLVQAGGTCTYTAAAQAPAGNGNITDRLPAFADSAKGDYSLTAASPCRSAGENGEDLGYRPYVASPAARCSFTYVFAEGGPPATVTFTASVEGDCGAVESYSWDFGDGSAADTTSGATALHEFSTAGSFTVTLTVVTEKAGAVSAAVPRAVNLGSDTVYVNQTGSGQFPYASPETATDDIQKAIDAVVASDERPGKVLVGESGTAYALKDNARFILTRPVEVIGAGRGETVIDGTGGKSGVFLVQHDKAAVCNLTVRNGTWSTSSANECGGFNLEKGTVSNCVVQSCKGNFSGAVRVSGGRFVDSLVSGGSQSNSGAAGKGAGVYQTDGWIEGVVISNCTGSSMGAGLYTQAGTATNITVVSCKIGNGNCRGGGLHISGGKVYGAVVNDCSVTPNAGSQGGGGVYMDTGTLADSVITNCTCTYRPGGGIYLDGGTVERVVVAENKSGTYGGGVYMAKTSTLNHVTIARNNAATSGSGLSMLAGTVKNSIVAANGYAAGQSSVQIDRTGGTISYSCSTDTLEDKVDGNLREDPLFRKAENGDYRLLSSSPCRGVADDDGDMGAIPYVFDPTAEATVSIAIQTEGAVKPVLAVLTAIIEGEPSSPVVEYVWSFGDGRSETTSTNAVAHVYEAIGSFPVSVSVKLESDDSINGTNDEGVSVASDVAYVSLNGSNEAPYDTLAKAAHSFVDAISTVYVPADGHATVWVEPGTYTQDEALDIRIARAIHLKSMSGKRDVIIDCQGTCAFRACCEHDAACVSGIEVRNSVTAGGWGALQALPGTFTNCAVIAAGPGGYAGGGHVRGDNAKIVDCVFSLCSCRDGNGGGNNGMGGVLVESGLLENCVFSNCWADCNGTVQQNGGMVRNMTIVGGTGRGRAFFMKGGLAENCRIQGCGDNGAGGECVGVYMTGGTLRNSLVTGNTSDKVPAGIRAEGTAVVENCTVTGNAGTQGGLVSGDSAQWWNVISWDNAGGDSLGKAKHTTCLLGTDPKFRHPERGDYRPRSGSPAQNAGTILEWMDGAVDLDGKPRIQNRKVDIGCYEVPQAGLIMFFY